MARISQKKQIQTLLLKFDEINKINEYNGDLYEYLYEKMKESYILGYEYADSKNKPPSDFEELIFFTIDGKDAFDRLEEALNDKDTARTETIYRTEMHRMFNAGSITGALKQGYTHKIWGTMLDDKVRDTHDYLENMKVPLDAKFFTYDGDSADYPGGFSNASNNVNCRCALEFT